MKRFGVLLALLVVSGLFGAVVKPVSATDSENYVLIKLNKDNYQFDATKVAGIDWSYNGIGTLNVELVDNKTLKINLSTLADFLRLFAPPGYSTSTQAIAPSKTVLDDILDRLNANGAVIDTSLGSAATITWNDVTLSDTFGYSTVKVTVLGQRTYNGEDYTVGVDVTGTAYVVGWRNNRGTVQLDGQDISMGFHPNPYTPITLNTGSHTIKTITEGTFAKGYTAIAFSIISLDGSDYTVSGKLEHANYEVTYTFTAVLYEVTFSLKDALTGQGLTGVTVKDTDGTVLGTVDDGQALEIVKGQYTLTFEKEGYWSVTRTIDVQNDMSVSVEMYPDSTAFQLENFPANITIPENTLYTLTFTLSPISTDATYNTYLSVSGLQNLIEVRKDGSVISPEGGKYYLGDISSPVQVSIKFKAGAVGTHGFTLTLTSNDAIMSKTYMATKSVTYQVEPLPFSVQAPAEWTVGANELRISESSGQSYLITAVLKDSSGNEVWSDSYAFSPYEAHTFSVDVPSEGQYTLEIQFQGKTAVYDITVNQAITLTTKTLTVEKGGVGAVTLHFKNPSSDVQYYVVKVSGGFLDAPVNKTLSIAPLSEKDVSIAFAVPDNLEYDAYELNVQVLQGDAVVFQDKVAVSISEGSGLTLFGGGGGSHTLLLLGGGLLLFGGLVFVLRRR